MLAAIKNSLYICSNNSKPINFSHELRGIIHPPTYLNKVLIWTAKELAIVNVITMKIVVQIAVDSLFERLQQTYDEHEVLTVEASPALDVVAVSLGHLTNSLVVLFNLQTFTVV